MLTYRVEDMTCGHCASAIRRAVQALDAGASADVDLVQKLVHVQPGAAVAEQVRDAISDAGYTPIAIAAASPKPANGRRSSCCGCCG